MQGHHTYLNSPNKGSEKTRAASVDDHARIVHSSALKGGFRY